MRKELRAFVIVNALGFAALALLSAWLLAGVDRRRPWDAAAFAASPALLLTGLDQLGHARGGAGRRRAVDVGARTGRWRPGC